MSLNPSVVLDAMGGDAGVDETVQGAARISISKQPFPIKLVGVPGDIRSALNREKYAAEWIEVCAINQRHTHGGQTENSIGTTAE